MDGRYMMGYPKTSPEQIVKVLNTLLELDPRGISSLVNHRVETNSEVDKQPGVQVALAKRIDGTEEEFLALGLLGIINGTFPERVDRWGEIGVEVEGDGTVTRFYVCDTEEHPRKPGYAAKTIKDMMILNGRGKEDYWLYLVGGMGAYADSITYGVILFPHKVLSDKNKGTVYVVNFYIVRAVPEYEEIQGQRIIMGWKYGAHEQGRTGSDIRGTLLTHVEYQGSIKWDGCSNTSSVALFDERSNHTCTGWELSTLGLVLGVVYALAYPIFKRGDRQAIIWKPDARIERLFELLGNKPTLLRSYNPTSPTDTVH